MCGMLSRHTSDINLDSSEKAKFDLGFLVEKVGSRIYNGKTGESFPIINFFRRYWYRCSFISRDYGIMDHAVPKKYPFEGTQQCYLYVCIVYILEWIFSKMIFHNPKFSFLLVVIFSCISYSTLFFASAFQTKKSFIVEL